MKVKKAIRRFWRDRTGLNIKTDASWECYQFDDAVVFFGNIIESALQETKEVGSGNNKRHEQKYKLSQLLDDKFRLPASKTSKTGGADDLASLLKKTKRGP